MGRLLFATIIVILVMLMATTILPTPVRGEYQTPPRKDAGNSLERAVRSIASLAQVSWAFLGVMGDATKDSVLFLWELSPGSLGFLACLALPLALIGLKAVFTLEAFLNFRR